MKNKFLTYLVLTLLALLPATKAQVKEKQSNSKADAAGLLYQITGKNLKKPSYLFGTIHIICSVDMLPMDKLTGFLDQTERVVLEVDMDDPAELQALQKGLMIPANGKTIVDVLKPDQLAKVDELLKNSLGVTTEQVKAVKPLALQVMLISNPNVIGCQPPSSYEAAFLQAAAASKKPVEGLETAASQVIVIDSSPLEKQAMDLYEMALDPQKSYGEFKKLLEAYKSQDSEMLYQVMNSQVKKEDKDFKIRLLDNRNKEWIPKIERAITEKPTFVAVGGGHLGGENGVIKLLRAKGYTVQAIKL